MGATALWARAEARRHAGSLVAVAVIAALTTGVVLTAALGARRAPGALQRLEAATLSSQVRVCLNCPWPASDAEALAILAVSPDFDRLFPGYHILAVAVLDVPGADPVDFPLVTEGRQPNPAATDEIAVSEDMAAALGVGVGDRLELQSATEELVFASFEGATSGPPDGPHIDATVTGVTRTPLDFSDRVGLLSLTSAFAERYSPEVQTWRFASARLATPADGERLAHDGAPGLDEPQTSEGDADAADGLRADPKPGAVVVSLPVLLVGGAGVVVAIGLVVAAASARVATTRGRKTRPAGGYVPLGHPLPAVLGVRTAVGAAGRASVSRGSVVGGALATAGVVTAVAVGASIHHLREDLTLSGQDDGYSIDSSESAEVLDAALPVLAADTRLAYLGVAHVFFPELPDGQGSPAIAFDEIVVGPRLLRDADIELGDTIVLAGQPVEVVGIQVAPQPGNGSFGSTVTVLAESGTFTSEDPIPKCPCAWRRDGWSGDERPGPSPSWRTSPSIGCPSPGWPPRASPPPRSWRSVSPSPVPPGAAATC
jgi:hypothetical protein